MGIAILVIMGVVAAFGAFAFLALTRGSRQHPRHVRGSGYDAAQSGAMWSGDSGGWSGGGSCGDGGGGGSC